MCHIIPYHIYLQYIFSIFPFGSEQKVFKKFVLVRTHNYWTTHASRNLWSDGMIMVKMCAALH